MPQRRDRPFSQVDVFGETPYLGNPVAVVHDGAGLSERDMAQFAAWTNLSETTFLVPPRSERADYGLRIFTPAREIPFAGHPTLGSAHAWLEAGGVPRSPGTLVQECGGDLVELRRSDAGLSFRAPDLRRTGPLENERLDHIAQALRISREHIIGHQWVDNGPGWAAVRLASAEEVLALEPDSGRMGEFMLGVLGAYPEGSPVRFEVRAFAAPAGVAEDPVTGSLNAGLAQWLTADGAAPRGYRVGQGARVGRKGVVTVRVDEDAVWIGGDTVICVRGVVHL